MDKRIIKIVVGAIIIFIGFMGNLKAQTPQERLKSIKVAFLTDKLRLTPEQAQNFWAVYNMYDSEKTALRKQIQVIRKEKFNLVSTDSEMSAAIDEFLGLQSELIEVEKKYKDKFLEVINIRQLVVLFKSENEFRKILLDKIKDNQLKEEIDD